MKVVVLVKRVPDTASSFDVNATGDGLLEGRLKFILNPYDEHAVQEAVHLKARHGASITVLALGDAHSTEVLRIALAMGADNAVLVTGEGVANLGPRGTSEALAAAVREIAPYLVLAGKQAVDGDGAQVPERVAELLGWPHASAITRLHIADGRANVDREVEGGHLVLDIPLPAIFTTQKGINKPEYPKLPNIMKARKQPVIERTLAELGLNAADLVRGTTVLGLALPRQERLERLLEGGVAAQVSALVRLLREEEKVL